MHIEELRAYCLNKKGVTEEFPFDKDTLVFKVMGKMFALSGLEHVPAKVNLKCDPDRALELRATYDGVITPGYHMSKKHWNTIEISAIAPGILTSLIDHSYELVVSKMTKKLQAALNNL